MINVGYKWSRWEMITICNLFGILKKTLDECVAIVLTITIICLKSVFCGHLPFSNVANLLAKWIFSSVTQKLPNKMVALLL
jgi:hypothetical protein